MTREEVFKRIWNWHNFLYRYTDDKIVDFRYVVLGYCESSRPDELNITSYDMQMLDKMIEAFWQAECIKFQISVTVDLKIEKPNKSNWIS